MSEIAAVLSPNLPPFTARWGVPFADTGLPCHPDTTGCMITGDEATRADWHGKAAILALALAGAGAWCGRSPAPAPPESATSSVAAVPAARAEFARLQCQLTTQGESMGGNCYRLREAGPAGETRVILGEFGRSYRHLDCIVTRGDVQPTLDGYWVRPSERLLEIEYTEYLSDHGETVGGMVKSVSSANGDAKGVPRQHVTTVVDAHGVLVRHADAPLTDCQVEWLEKFEVQP